MGDSVHPQHSFKRWFTIGKGGGCYYYHPDIVEDGKITVRHGEYVTDIITNRALDFIDELSGTGRSLLPEHTLHRAALALGRPISTTSAGSTNTISPTSPPSRTCPTRPA